MFELVASPPRRLVVDLLEPAVRGILEVLVRAGQLSIVDDLAASGGAAGCPSCRPGTDIDCGECGRTVYLSERPASGAAGDSPAERLDRYFRDGTACEVCRTIGKPDLMPIDGDLGRVCIPCHTAADRIRTAWSEALEKAASEFTTQLPQLVRDARAGAPEPVFYRGFE